MNGIIARINTTLKCLLKQKGQSLTEFVLILACCAAIGWAANEVGIMDAIGAVFDSGARPPQEMAAIGGATGSSNSTPTTTPDPEPEPEPPAPPTSPVGPGVGLSGFNWGEINPNTYFEQSYEDKNKTLDGGNTWVNFETAEASQADRLAADQKALENIARFFIGKTKEQVSGLLKEKYLNKADMGAGNPGDSETLNLGHFRLSNSMSAEGTGMQFVVTDSDGLKASEAENIFKWMVDPENPGSVQYKNDYNYLVSDYVVSQGWVNTIAAGNDQKNGLKLRLEYDYAGKYAPEGGYANANDVIVIGAHVTIDPKSQFNNQLGGSDKKYNRKNSQGLDVQVRMDDNGEIQVAQKNTGIPVTNGKVAEGKAGTYNWYGEGDYRLVKAYFDSKAITLDETNITHEFKEGELIKTGNNSWYVYASSSNKTLTVNNKSITNDFVKIETNTWRYWHENDKTEDGPNIKTIKNRGTLFTKDNGDIFVYVGKQPPSSGIPINIVTDINESNSDWIKIGNLKQSENEGQGQDEGQGEGQGQGQGGGQGQGEGSGQGQGQGQGQGEGQGQGQGEGQGQGQGQGQGEGEGQGQGQGQGQGEVTVVTETSVVDEIIAFFNEKGENGELKFNVDNWDHLGAIQNLLKEKYGEEGSLSTYQIQQLAKNNDLWKTDSSYGAAIKAATGWVMTEEETQIRNSIMEKYNAQYQDINNYLVSNNVAGSDNLYHICNQFLGRNSEYSSINNEQMQLITQYSDYQSAPDNDKRNKLYSAYWSLREK